MSQAWVYAQAWENSPEQGNDLRSYLGLDETEYAAFRAGADALGKALLPQRRQQQFRIYQMDFSAGQVIPFAFQGIKAMLEARYRRPKHTGWCATES